VDLSPAVERRGCCDKEASKDQEVKLRDGELVSDLYCSFFDLR
jgi:hypothetical protein